MSDAWNALREQIEYFSQPFPEAARLRQPGYECQTFELLDSVVAVATDIPALAAAARNIKSATVPEMPC